MSIVIIESPDRHGKSTCVDHLVKNHGFGGMHFGRPEGDDSRQRALYQKATFDRTFRFISALEGQQARIVLDRGHLGEWVYGPLYRAGSGVDLAYLWEGEDPAWRDVYLVLLHHRDLDVIRSRDDGLGFDISKLEDEQRRFHEAFELSRIRNKVVIDVTTSTIPQMLKELEDVIGLPNVSITMPLARVEPVGLIKG